MQELSQADQRSQKGNWPRARCTPSGSCRARSENRFSHSMNDFFVRGADGSKHSPKMRAGLFGFASDEIVRTQAHASFHRDNFVAREIEPLGVHQAGFM